MKKYLIVTILMLLIASFVCAGALAGTEKTWPVIELNGEDTSLNLLSDSEGRRQAYYGPGSNYAQAGAYKPYKIVSVEALYRDGNYTLVDMDYQTAGKRCVYFQTSYLSSQSAKASSPDRYPATTTVSLIPMCGPGLAYEAVVQREPSPYADWNLTDLVGKFGGSWEIYEALQDRTYTVVLPQNSRVNSLFETEGWVFAEFDCSIGLIRAWLPAEYVISE